jgi:hypothetical protein
MVVIQNNDQIYDLLEHYESTQVLTLLVKRGMQKNNVVYDHVDANEDEGIAGSQSASCIINYEDMLCMILLLHLCMLLMVKALYLQVRVLILLLKRTEMMQQIKFLISMKKAM